MPKEQWIVKNETNKSIAIGDLPRLPSIAPGKVIDLLIYYEYDRINNSSDLKDLLDAGWLDLTKNR